MVVETREVQVRDCLYYRARLWPRGSDLFDLSLQNITGKEDLDKYYPTWEISPLEYFIQRPQINCAGPNISLTSAYYYRHGVVERRRRLSEHSQLSGSASVIWVESSPRISPI
jgi:hypothetical protein